MNYPLDTGLNRKALCKWVPGMKGPLPKRRISASGKGAHLARALNTLENCFGRVVRPFAMKYLPRQLYFFGKCKMNSFW